MSPLFTGMPLGGAGGQPKATVTGTTGAPTIDTSSRPGKTIYKFTGSGSITIGTAGTCEILVVGGGGAGGRGNSTNSWGGGGGAGQVLYFGTNCFLPSGTNTVQIASGSSVFNTYVQYQGGTSYVANYYAIGGGGGAGPYSATPTTALQLQPDTTFMVGGSGASSTLAGISVPSLYDKEGNGTYGTFPSFVTYAAGGAASTSGAGGGGGGAGGVANGGAGSGTTGGAGGNGLANSITGSSVTYGGGGGGGGGATGGGTAGTGGTGGGGNGAGNGTVGVAGTANSGGGGGGGNSSYSSGTGGSGYVVVVIG